MRRILIATDGSACSGEAVRQFAQLGTFVGADLAVLAVVPPADVPSEHPFAANYYHREADAAQDALDLALADLALAGFSAYGLVRVGRPAATILEVAQEYRADMIVLGTHGRQGLDRLMKGSVAEDVLRDAPCAVFIYPFQASTRAEVEAARS